MNLEDFLRRQKAFSEVAFGGGRRTIGITEHIKKEIEEVRAAEDNLEEWIDIVILGLDGAWRMGATPEQIAEMLEAKLAKNMARRWPKPQSQDEAILHIKEPK